MRDDFYYWFSVWSGHPAKWYEFYFPASGTIGGAIMGGFLGLIVSAVIWL